MGLKSENATEINSVIINCKYLLLMYNISSEVLFWKIIKTNYMHYTYTLYIKTYTVNDKTLFLGNMRLTVLRAVSLMLYLHASMLIVTISPWCVAGVLFTLF